MLMMDMLLVISKIKKKKTCTQIFEPHKSYIAGKLTPKICIVNAFKF